MAVYLSGVTLGLVKDINLFLIADEHLVWSRVRSVEQNVSTRERTIMADTNVSPTSTIEPGLCAAVAVEASPRASKERLEYIAWYSDAKY